MEKKKQPFPKTRRGIRKAAEAARKGLETTFDAVEDSVEFVVDAVQNLNEQQIKPRVKAFTWHWFGGYALNFAIFVIADLGLKHWFTPNALGQFAITIVAYQLGVIAEYGYQRVTGHRPRSLWFTLQKGMVGAAVFSVGYNLLFHLYPPGIVLAKIYSMLSYGASLYLEARFERWTEAMKKKRQNNP